MSAFFVLETAGNFSYTYDDEGNRNAVSNGTSTARYTVNPTSSLSQVLVREKNGKTTYYVYGYGLISEETNGKTLTYHFDVRGSTVAITNESGRVTDTFTYDAYGNELNREGNTDTPFRYCGAYGVQTDDNFVLSVQQRLLNLWR